MAGLLDLDHQRKTRELTHKGRAYLEEQFGLMGLEYVPSQANFVLVKVGDGERGLQGPAGEGSDRARDGVVPIA